MDVIWGFKDGEKHTKMIGKDVLSVGVDDNAQHLTSSGARYTQEFQTADSERPTYKETRRLTYIMFCISSRVSLFLIVNWCFDP